jgi:hypothetical protein
MLAEALWFERAFDADGVSCHSMYLARMGLNLATVVFERS